MTRIPMIAAAALIAMTGAAAAASHAKEGMMAKDFPNTVVNQDPYLATLMGAALLNGTGDAHSGIMKPDGTVMMDDGTVMERFPR
ncbi:MAG: hypothetical protein ACMVY4_14720 [Minwuia sp.]|uniref:hypothetical protein n=1 Tax=Minwuia sp. TaxID=2493630 RepID=UPI003A8C2553